MVKKGNSLNIHQLRTGKQNAAHAYSRLALGNERTDVLIPATIWMNFKTVQHMKEASHKSKHTR